MSSTDAVQVAVRVRPLSVKEMSKGGGSSIVKVQNNSIQLLHPRYAADPQYAEKNSAADRRVFHFDKCFAADVSKMQDNANQEKIFKEIGAKVVENAFGGFNCCVFAYGQVG